MSDIGATQARAYREHQLLEQDRQIKALKWACIRSGYSLTVHGTRGRDLDLVAVPWTDDADTVGRLLARMVGAGFIHSTPEKKPHGRVAYTLRRQDHADMGCLYIDLSIMPRQQRKRTRR